MKPIAAITLLCISAAVADDAFRTDANNDENLPWFHLVPGEFPPEGSAHYFPGELIRSDHLKRSFVVRNDRSDKQNRSHFDLPVGATMLPFGSVFRHGAPAALKDIPVGTHLHGLYFMKDPEDPSKSIEGWHNRKSYHVDFTRCFRLEDDFSYYRRRGQIWRVDSVSHEDGKLSATLLQDEKPVSEAKTFDLLKSTRVWQGRQIAKPADIAENQLVQFNITWATLYGPGRICDIWLDEESRQLATDHQTHRHHQHIRERGLAGWIDAVDNKQRIVTITFFGGVDPALLDEMKQGDQAGVAVALESLMTFDPVNDRKRGPILDVKEVPRRPGSSGVQISVQPDLLLEGYRPGRIVRVYPSAWPVIALPREEQFFGQD